MTWDWTIRCPDCGYEGEGELFNCDLTHACAFCPRCDSQFSYHPDWDDPDEDDEFDEDDERDEDDALDEDDEFDEVDAIDEDDLNQVVVGRAGDFEEKQARAEYGNGMVQAYFGRLEDHLSDMIQRSEAIVGCVAWLTNPRLLRDLSRCNHVSIVVNRWDVLRPDVGERKGFASRLRRAYARLPGGLERCPEFMGSADDHQAAVRWLGVRRRDKAPFLSSMHHKFLLSCRFDGRLLPETLWTGSYNLATASNQSLENAIVTTIPAIVRAYYQMWCRLSAASEPIVWPPDDQETGR